MKSVIALITCATSAHAGIIIDQPPFVGAGGPASDTAFINDYGEDSWEISADEFIAPRTAAVSKIVWWGFYGGNNPAGSFHPPTGNEWMRIRFYAPRAGDGLPGNISYESTILNPSRTPTGASYGPHPAYRFEGDLTIPFSLAESTHYWFEVTQIDDPKSVFRRFQFPDTETPYAFLNNWVTNWYLDYGGLSFQLLDIPEPSTLSFWAIPFIALLWKGMRFPRTPLGRVLWAMALGVVACRAASHAGIIVDQSPVIGAGGPSSDTALIDDYGNPGWEISADEFISPAIATVHRVVWWGFYGGNNPAGSFNPPTGDEIMRIRFYQPRNGDGLPGSILYEASVLNATRVATGSYYGPHPEFRFETNLDIPFSINSASHYWFEVSQVGDVNSWFRRPYSPDFDTPYAYLNDWVSDWDRLSLGGLSFQLIDVPEPSTSCFLMASFIALFWKGVRGRRLGSS